MPKKNRNSVFLLRLAENESVFSFLINYARENQFGSAIFTGIGALSDITISFYHRDIQEHSVKNFIGTFEIASLNGNITLVDNKPFVHMHASVSDKNFVVWGGHIIEAHASVSTEIAIMLVDETITREYDATLNMFLIPKLDNICNNSEEP